MSLLVKAEPEITDISLVILADLNAAGDGGRVPTRLAHLACHQAHISPLIPLEKAGLVQRKKNGFAITDKGVLLCRSLLATLKNACA